MLEWKKLIITVVASMWSLFLMVERWSMSEFSMHAKQYAEK
jgi:hypothetical protein